MKKILLIIIISVPLICIGLFLGDWVYSEITFRVWLNQDQRHIDFSLYTDEKQLREALFAKLPVGSPEEEVKAFYLANRKYSLELTEWQPKIISDKYGVALHVWTGSHGNIVTRVFSGRWIIFFHLDPIDHSLEDITARRFGSEL
jgi:hypothetical protein